MLGQWSLISILQGVFSLSRKVRGDYFEVESKSNLIHIILQNPELPYGTKT